MAKVARHPLLAWLQPHRTRVIHLLRLTRAQVLRRLDVEFLEQVLLRRSYVQPPRFMIRLVSRILGPAVET